MLANVLFDSDRFDDAVALLHKRMLRTNSRAGLQDALLSPLRQAKRYAESIDLSQALLAAVSAIRRMAPQPPGRAGPAESVVGGARSAAGLAPILFT